MELLAELQEQIDAYVRGQQPLTALQDWLTLCAEELAESSSPQVHDLAGQTWLLLSEYGAGDRDELGVREALSIRRSRAPAPSR